MTANSILINNKKAAQYIKAFMNNDSFPINLIAIHPLTGKIEGITVPSGDSVYSFIAKHNNVCNLYFTVNTPLSGSPNTKLKKSHFEYINAVWLDADPVKNKPFDDEQIRLSQLADTLKASDNPPTYIIHSGGGIQAFWVLSKPVKATKDNVLLAEAYSRSLAETYNADKVQNIDRIMRIPFTMNLPTKKKKDRSPTLATVIHADSKLGTRYSWDDLSFITPSFTKDNDTTDESTPLDMTAIKQPLPTSLKNKLKSTVSKNKKIQDLINNTIDKPSRSEKDFTLSKELKWEGYTLLETAHILYHFKHGKNKQLTKREIIRCYQRSDNPFEGLSPEYINEIAAQTNPILEEKNELLSSSFITAGEATYKDSAIPLFKKLIDRETIILTYGPSNSGKSFLKLDMAMHLAAGLDWAGYKCKEKMSVLYVCTEAGPQFGKRVVAARQRLGFAENVPLGELPFAYFPGRIDILNNKKHVKMIERLVDELEQLSGVKCGLVVFDTVAACFGGGNENSSEDVGKFFNNIMDLKFRRGVAVDIVHHTGKDETAGARGHSSFKGNVDTELRIKSERRGEKYYRGFVPTKQRDDETDNFTKFGLNIVTLGNDVDGDPITTCHMVFEDDDEFSDVSASMLDDLSASEIAAIKAVHIYDVNNLNPDMDCFIKRGFSEKQIKVILMNNIVNNGPLVDGLNVKLGDFNALRKPNRDDCRPLERAWKKMVKDGSEMVNDSYEIIEIYRKEMSVYFNDN